MSEYAGKYVTVYVNITSPVESGHYGETNIVIPKDDRHRAEFLRSCELFFADHERQDDAAKFHQAIKQTPWDASDD